MIGRTLSHFRIVEKIGEGGMGVVYRAEDEQLRRPVALKVLPPELVGDEERRLRFLREARAAAAVTHPNIATVYEVGEADGVVFIAMEFLEGRTLAETIGGRPLSVREILRVGIEVAEGLAKAHAAHVIHRDLKPDNIVVTPDGRVKILDFGLAKLLGENDDPGGALSRLQTISGDMTRAGRILGTASYMSPEQARGEVVDPRTDIFSFGVTLYEMATGRVPFHGKTVTDTLSAIVRDPAPSAIETNPVVPEDLDRIIQECMEKETAERYQHADQLVVDLRRLKKRVESGTIQARRSGPVPASAARRRPGGRVIGMVAAVAVLVLAGVAWVVLRGRPAAVSGQPTAPRLTFTRITLEAGEEQSPSLSPDGKSVVYAGRASGNWDIYLQRIGGARAINLTADSSADDTRPAFSPEGERIAFRSEREGGGLFVMGATGESVRRVTDVGHDPTWSPDGREIVLSTEKFAHPNSRQGTSQLWVVDLASEARRKISDGDAVQPAWSPNGHRIAYWANREGQRDLWTIPAGGGDPVPVIDDPPTDWSPVWSSDGRHLYFSSDRGGSMNLWRVPIDETSGRTLGPPEPITAPASFAGNLSVARDGKRIVYESRAGTTFLHRAAFDPVAGRIVGRPTTLAQGARSYLSVDVSSDGEWLAVWCRIEQDDICVMRVDGSGLRQLIDDPHKDRRPRWAPDGKSIVFYSNRGGNWDVWTMGRDGSGLTRITDSPTLPEYIPAFSPDGRTLAYTAADDRVFTLDATRPLTGQQAVALPDWPRQGTGAGIEKISWSPDSTAIAGTVLATDWATWMVQYSFKTRTWERLVEHGAYGRWLGDGRRILFAHQGKLSLLDVGTKQSTEIFDFGGSSGLADLDLSPDGKHLYMAVESPDADLWLINLD